jgi:Asp-tRNA(Asn)/Glu-tRNA(Gln) amidotransferase A subunit family amidase
VVIPVTADHDTAGHTTRSVTDAEILFRVLESEAPDPSDAATKICTPNAKRDYTKFLKRNSLKARVLGFQEPFIMSA